MTVYYTSHENSAYSSKGGTLGSKDYTKAITSNTSYTNLSNSMSAGGWGNSLRVEYKQKTAENGVTYYQDYFVELVRAMTMNSLSATDNNGIGMPLTQADTTTTEFAKLVYDYTAMIGAGAREMSLTFKPLSSYKYDSDFIVTLTCGDWSQRIEYSADITPSVEQTVTVPLSGTMDTDTVCVTVSHKDSTSIPQTYTIAVSKLPPVNTIFTVTPADATIFLTEDSTGSRICPEADGTFILNADASYTYVITKNGYVAQTASFTAGEANKAITIDLEKAPESAYKDIQVEGDWIDFRGETNGIVDAKIPIKAEDAVLEWANKIGEGMDSGATGCPIIVGGYIYTYAGQSIVKVNKNTGEVVAAGVMIGSSNFAINSPTYANGMIFVGLSNGRVQAFNAETLESLWVFQDALGGQPNCPIAYSDGYIYTGFWNSETKQANFVCLSVTDEDTANTTESKLPTWTYTHNGFYWAGAYACEDFVLVGTDDGDTGYTKGFASILSLDPKTGILLDEEKLPNVGDQRSSICYDAATDAYYFTTKGGDFYQVRVNADGTFTENSLRRLHLDNGSGSDSTPPMSTSTPVIYNGRAYIGVSGTGQFSAYSGHNITVIDLETLSIAYTVPTMGYPQTSGLLTTAYEETDGYVYVYFVDNFTPGMVRVIRDKKGMTEVDHSYTSTATVTVSGESKTIETGYILFTPYGDEAQYAICSPISDTEGNLYFKNDTARLMRVSSRMTSLEITQQPENLTYCVGQTFNGGGMQVMARYANGVSKDVTQYVSFTTDPLTADDTEITVSFDPDKQFESTTTAAGGYWQWYQDQNGTAGTPFYLPTATVTITIEEEIEAPAVAKWNLILGDDIGANFYVQIHDELVNQTVVNITVGEETASLNASDAQRNSDGTYIFPIHVAAAQMTDTITVEIVYGDQSVTQTYTVRQYAKNILEGDYDEVTKQLVRDMLNYGAMAQMYFGYNAENLANADIDGAGQQAIPETAETEMSTGGSMDGIYFYGGSLLFRSKTAVRFYFHVTGDASAYTFVVNGVAKTAVEKDGLWYVEISDISPQDLDKSIELSVTAGDQTITVVYGPMNYMMRMNQKGSDALKALLQAMYNYHLSAAAYQEAQQEA